MQLRLQDLQTGSEGRAPYRREDRGAEGAKGMERGEGFPFRHWGREAPRGLSVGRGVPFATGRDLRRRQCLLLRIFVYFGSQNVDI